MGSTIQFWGKPSGFCAPKNMSNISHVPSPSQNPAVDFKGKTGVTTVDMNAKLPNIYIYIHIYTYIYIYIQILAPMWLHKCFKNINEHCGLPAARLHNIGRQMLVSSVYSQYLIIMFHCGSSKLYYCHKKGHPCAPLKRCLRNPSRSSQTWICLNTPRKGQKYMPYSP